MTRKFSAHYIFPVSSPPLKYGIVITDNSGTIIDVIDTHGKLHESENLEFYNGIITPGFINTHTHLELSHLRKKVPQHTGITGFIQNLQTERYKGDINKAIYQAETEMINNGIVAVGDIVNTEDTFEIKKEQNLLYHSFVEIFATDPQKAENAWQKGIALYNKLQQLKLKSSVTPHAPYSVSSSLWNYFCENYSNTGSFWSIHNQESQDENFLFLNKSGKFPEILHNFYPDFTKWNATGKSSLQSMIGYLSLPDKFLLVHNTFTTSEDLEALAPLKHKISLILCPGSNQYIENTLPDVQLFDKYGCNIAIGTDSLASNTGLSILDELKILQNESSIPFFKLVQWATLNGAKALGFEGQLGSIEIGKKPGLNLLTGFNFNTMSITEKSKVRVLI